MTTLDESAIGHRSFTHRQITYTFTYKEIQRKMLENVTVRRLYKYIQLVRDGRFPNALFENPSVPRASLMKIRGLGKAQKAYLQQVLFEQRLVERVPPDRADIPRLVQDVFQNFKAEAIDKVPDHGPVLKSILIRHPLSVAIELPVWRVAELRSNCLTGHVDLVQVETGKKTEIKILDYKPEGENRFIFSIPQIALYARMLNEKLLPDPECEINCYIFDKKAMWKFQPSILQALDDKLAQYQIPRDWKPFMA
ncbi:MAG: hypothetical protein JW839_07940 [Candidatus Lokiarchaeota archaeon]|nr:hypothetical protein [Candidatus Lokiarchaeota archaeon]